MLTENCMILAGFASSESSPVVHGGLVVESLLWALPVGLALSVGLALVQARREC